MSYDTGKKAIQVEATTDDTVQIAWSHPRSGRTVLHSYVLHRDVEVSELARKDAEIRRLREALESVRDPLALFAVPGASRVTIEGKALSKYREAFATVRAALSEPEKPE